MKFEDIEIGDMLLKRNKRISFGFDDDWWWLMLVIKEEGVFYPKEARRFVTHILDAYCDQFRLHGNNRIGEHDLDERSGWIFEKVV